MDYVSLLISKNEKLSCCADDINKAINAIVDCYKNDGKLLLCGNGGSAADSTHIVGELMKGFLKRRPVEGEKAEALKTANPKVDDLLLSKLQCGLPAVNLCESSSLLTAYCNDVDPDYIFAQQVFGLGKKGDVFIGLSTSGNAKNINHAAKVAKALGITVIGMTGNGGGALAENSDICIKAPETETYLVQEAHLPIYHAICAAVEEEFFKK
ncbi:MAG: SIS domain-containing protein [Clostridia bacterium]|nr:SIS domain-containing protein [Clostridia bacterium]